MGSSRTAPIPSSLVWGRQSHPRPTTSSPGKSPSPTSSGQGSAVGTHSAQTSLLPRCCCMRLTDKSSVRKVGRFVSDQTDVCLTHVLVLPAQYSAEDDLESLAYTLLEVRYSGWLPWAEEICAAASSNPSFGETMSDLEFVVKTRAKHLDVLRGDRPLWSPLQADDAQEGMEIIDFVLYARGLKPGGGRIHYTEWEKAFRERYRPKDAVS